MNESAKQEYIFIPGKEHHAYVRNELPTSKNRYWWREADVSESSPVSVPELMKALGSVMPSTTQRQNLQSMLYATMSERVTVAGEDNLTVALVSQKHNGRKNDLSPSNVETMMSVLTMLHDAGIDYTIASGKNNTINLRILDNSGSRITLLDPGHPYLTGQIQTREGVFWNTELTRLTYKTAEEAKNPALSDRDDLHAIAGVISQSGLEMSPMAHSQAGMRIYKNSQSNLDFFFPRDREANAQTSQIVGLARYVSLDQQTKNTLALSGIVEVLGLNKQTFNKSVQSAIPDAKFETVYRMEGSYQAQLNLGVKMAHMAPVSAISSDGQQNSLTPVREVTEGDIRLDMRSGLVGEDPTDLTRASPAVNPYRLNRAKSATLINVAYRDARINFLNMLLNPAQKSTSQFNAKAQESFRRNLANEVMDVTLSESGHGTEKRMREPLGLAEQAIILNQFKEGILTASADEKGVDDSGLQAGRDFIRTEAKNNLQRARRLEAFDSLIAQMNDTFGTAPTQNTPVTKTLNDGTPTEFLAKYGQVVAHRSESAELMSSASALNNELANMVLAHNNETLPDVLKGQERAALSAMSYAEQLQRLSLINDSLTRQSTQHSYKETYSKLINDHPLNRSLNLTRIIDMTSEGSNSTLYGFMMAQAVNHTDYVTNLVGDTEYASTAVQERAITFNGGDAARIAENKTAIGTYAEMNSKDAKAFVQQTAMTAEQLRAADKNPASPEFKLQEYFKAVRSGEKRFSFNDPDNPDPSAFNRDGTHLINDVSPNEFKARALDTVTSKLKQYGAQSQDTEVMIDNQGVIRFKTRLPLYVAATHEQQVGGAMFAEPGDTIDKLDREFAEKGKPGVIRDGNMVMSTAGRAYTLRPNVQEPAEQDKPRFKTVEGTFGQLFAPDHDGLVRSTYNRFDGSDVTAGQLVFQPRYRGTFLNPTRDAQGNWSAEALAAEKKNGLGHFNRLRVQGYEQAVTRELKQAVTNILSTKSIGDLTRYNSNTIMNKILHGETLGATVNPQTLKEQGVSELTQAERETELTAIRVEDAALESTNTPHVIANMHALNDQLTTMHFNSDVKVADRLVQAQVAMHDSITTYGGHSVGELAHSSGNLIVSDNMTGQGKMFGLLMYKVEGATVTSDGRVLPNAFQDSNGEYIRDKNGKIVGPYSGTPLEHTAPFNSASKNAADRQPVSKEQAIKGHSMLHDAKIATLAAGGLTMEDGLAISKSFADQNLISDETDSEGHPIMRPLMTGDKISDNGGNKATISAVIDPDMDLAQADQQGLLDTVALFKQHPQLDAVTAEMSQISRRNGATAYTYVERDSSQPMQIQRYQQQADGSYELSNQIVHTNASINSGELIITNQTINHKVTLYDKPGEDKGRKLSILLNNADNAKGAHKVANWYRQNNHDLQTLRHGLLSLGADLDGTQVTRPNYEEIAKETSEMSYNFTPEVEDLLSKKVNSYLTSDGQLSAKTKRLIARSASDVFDGLGADGDLTPNSKSFITDLRRAFLRAGVIALNSDDMTANKYNAGMDFVTQLPDGGVLHLPESLSIKSATGDETKDIYILPEFMRKNTIAMDGTTVTSDFNLFYQHFGTKLAQYKALVAATETAGLAKGKPGIQSVINANLAEQLGIQASVTRIQNEAERVIFGGKTPKYGFFRNYILGGYAPDSVTSQVANNPSLPLDVIEISPKIAKRLNFVAGSDGMAHMIDHADWNMLHVHRDPVWREQGSLAFRVKISDELIGVRISPVVASLMDADFDGDNLGLVAMGDSAVQQELRDKVSVNHWLLDNNQHASLLNINAEIVDMAVNTSNSYRVTSRDGKTLQGNFLNPQFRQEVLENVRPDVIKPDWMSSDGKLPKDKDGQPLLPPDMTDSDFLNIIVNNEIKAHYDKDDAIGARQAVDEIVQKARGFEVTRDQQGEVVIHAGQASMYERDGVNYASYDTLRSSLLKFANEGAKGSSSAVSGLLDDYMQKKTFTEMTALSNAVFRDGQFDEEAYNTYQRELAALHDPQSAVQRATKIKSDVTGLPGSIQQKLTAVMMDTSDDGMHVAAAIGQAGTQKILSIKRDPIMAGRVAEIFQGPIASLLRGEFPTADRPMYALVGSEQDGRFGNSPDIAAIRANKLATMPVPGTNVSFIDYKQSIYDLSLEDMQHVGHKLGMVITGENVDSFKTTVDEATQPYVRNDFMQDLRQVIANKQGKAPETVKVPLLAKKGEAITPITHEEFVEVMDFLYNDKDHGMGLGVDRANFEKLANVLEDPNSAAHEIRAISEATKENGLASFAAKTNMHGFSAIKDVLNDKDSNKELFGKDDSQLRKSTFAGLDDATLAQSLNLSKTDSQLALAGKLPNDPMQTKLFARVSADYQKQIIKLSQHGLVDENESLTERRRSLDDIKRVQGVVQKEPQENIPASGRTLEKHDIAQPRGNNLDAANAVSADTNKVPTNIVNSILKGTYRVNTGKPQTPRLQVNEQVSLDFMLLADQAVTLPDELKERMTALTNNPQDTNAQIADVLKEVNQVYANQTGTTLFEPEVSDKLLTRAYENQMRADPTVAKVLKKATLDTVDYNIAPHRLKAIEQAVVQYETQTQRTENHMASQKPHTPLDLMISGDYWAPITVQQHDGSQISGKTVNALFYTQLAKNKLNSGEALNAVVASQLDRQHYEDEFNPAVKNLQATCQKQTGQPLATEEEIHTGLANAYFVQMKTYPEIREQFEQAVQAGSSIKMNRARRQAIKMALQASQPNKPTQEAATANINKAPQNELQY